MRRTSSVCPGRSSRSSRCGSVVQHAVQALALAGLALLAFSQLAMAQTPSRDRPARPVRKAPAPEAAAQAPEPSAEPEQDPVKAEILKVNYVFNRGLYELALPRYEKIIAENPSHARLDLAYYPAALCRFNLAVAAPAKPASTTRAAIDRDVDRKEHLRKAVSHLKEALRKKELEPRAAATRLLGQSLLLLEDHESAAKAFQWVVDRAADSPEAPLARLGLAECHYHAECFEPAAALFSEALGALGRPQDVERARFFLGMCLYRANETGGKGDLAEAAKLFETVAGGKDGDQPSALALDGLYMLALTEQARGQLDRAQAAFRKLGGSGGPEQAELAGFGLATTLFRSGNYKEAVAELERFRAAYPASERREEASLLLARAQLETRQTTSAAKILQELRGSARVGDEASLWLARIFSRHGKARSAANVLSSALKAFPSSRLVPDLRLDLISALVGDNNFEGALREIEAAEGAGASGASADQTAYLKAYALHRAERYAEASQACAAFAAAYPESKHLKDVIQVDAESKLLAGDAPAARAAYEDLLQRFGQSLDPKTVLKARFRVAQAVYGAREYREALQLFEKVGAAIQQDPATAEAARGDPLLGTLRYLEGECAYQLKDGPRTVQALEAFLTEAAGRQGLEVEVDDARFKLAHSKQLAGRLEEARTTYQEALKAAEKSPHREQIIFELGQIAYSLKDYPAATLSLNQLLEETPTTSFAGHALKLLGWMALEGKDAAAAVKYYKRLLDEHPEHPAAADAEYHLGLALRSLGQEDEARAALARFRKAHPDDPRAGRAELEEVTDLVKSGKTDEALDALQKILARKPGPEELPHVLYELAWCRRARGEVDEARKAYANLLAAGGGSLADTAALELGELELESKRPAEARVALEPLARRECPQREKALYRLAWAFHSLEQPEEVVATQASLASLYPQSELLGEVTLLAGRALAARGENGKAVDLFLAVVARGPEAAGADLALVGLGEALAEERRFEEAQKAFVKFLSVHPKSPQVYRARFGLAWSLENLGQVDEALEKYREAARDARTPLAARAQFQIGQCLVAKKLYKDAIVELLQVPAAHTSPEWSAKALLQVAGCFEELEDLDNARKYYGEVKTSFAGRDEARLAEERLNRLETR